MRLLGCLSAGIIMVVVATSALAFDEQQVVPTTPQAADKSATSASDGVPGVELTSPDALGGQDTIGTEVRIPGLGKLGVLPKMDFGLELLYGAAELDDPKAQDEPENLDDDLRIRGTIKHRF